MERRRCAACEQAFRPRAQSPGQLYCGQAACQRERRRRWQRSKRQRDEDYRANQARAQRVWAADHRDYWRGWRAAHPEYTVNRHAKRTPYRHPIGTPFVATIRSHGCFFVRLIRAVSSSRPDHPQGVARSCGQAGPQAIGGAGAQRA
jgi:hypothetical protein